MADIIIDTSQLTRAKFQIVGSERKWFEGAPIIPLEPGEYGFQQSSAAVASFRFTVTPDGLIDYDDAYEAFLAGRGTSTLEVNGYRLTLDGTALSHDLKPTLEGVADLSRFHVHELVLAPATAYSVLSAGGIKANFDFNVELDGQVTVNEAYARFATFQEGTLTIRGYPITIDGRALAEDLLPLLLGVSTSLARDRTHELTLIPGAGYSFQTGAIVPDFQFELMPDGRLVVDPRFAAFATVADHALIIKPMSGIPLFQRLLTLLGFAIPEEERAQGSFGEGTGEAVRQFQTLLGLPPSGEMDDETSRVLPMLTYQHILTMLGYAISDIEQWRAHFGDTTREAILHFQAGQHLERSGELDNLTGEALLARAGNGRFSVTGKVTDDAGHPFVECTVQALDLDARTGAQRILGQTQPGADGAYTIEYTVKQLRELGKLRADLLVTVEHGADHLAQADPLLGAPPQAVIPAIVVHAAQPTFHTIRGRVRSVDGRPGRALRVTALDRDLRSEQVLNDPPALTDENGFFEITYRAEIAVAAEGLLSTVDLCFTIRNSQEQILDGVEIVRLPVSTGKSETLAAPVRIGPRRVIMNARPLEIVELIAAAEQVVPQRGPSEFETVNEAVARLLAGQDVPMADAAPRSMTPADLQENEEYNDFTFLQHETDIERIKLEHLAAAYRLAALMHHDVPEAPLYGLARVLGVIDPPGLTTHSTVTLTKALSQAIEENLIPHLEPDVEHWAQVIHALATAAALHYRSIDFQANLNDLIAPVLPDEAARIKLLSTYSNHEGDTSAFWQQVRRENPEIPVKKVQFALQLGLLSQNNAQVSQALLENGDFNEMRDLARTSDDRLRHIVQQAAPELPAELPGETQKAKQDFYVKSIRGALEVAFPTEAVTQVVASIPSAELAVVSKVLNRATSQTFTAHNQAFDIHSTHVDTFFAEHGTTILQDFDPSEHEAVKAQVKRTQRLYRLSTNRDSLKGLMESRFHSAYMIANVSKEQFVMEMQESLGGEEHATLVHERATAASTANLAMAVHLYQAANDVQPMAVGEGIKTMPTWAQIFGSVEMCDCEHCRSVYSPAAYLVDLLDFLENKCNINESGLTPQQVLLKRRPDIAHLQLTCENTNTPLPYIDLVNEILESYIVLEGRLDASTAHNTGESSASELRALPQHVEQTADGKTAYDTLAATVYPTLLPFDRWLEIARAFIEQLGGSRAALMQQFSSALAQRLKEEEVAAGLPVLPDDQYTTAAQRAIAGEQLGLSDLEYEILTGETYTSRTANLDAAAQLLRLYGVDPDEIYVALKLGDVGTAVTILQAKLNSWLVQEGHPQLTLNGRFDLLVEEPVKAFQAQHGLPVTGEVDEATWNPLKALEPEATAAFVAYVPEFLQRTGLSYVELLDLMQSRIINPHKRDWLLLGSVGLTVNEIRELSDPTAVPSPEIAEKLNKAQVTIATVRDWIDRYQKIGVVYPSGDSCDLETLFLQQLNGQPLSSDYFWKSQRFIRLWRKLGWTIQEVDLALVALGFENGVTSDAIQALAQVRQLSQQTDLSLEQLLSLWSNVNAHGSKSLFQQLFQNRSLLNPLDPDFDLSVTGDELRNTSKTISEKTPALLAALRLRPELLTMIRQAEKLTADEEKVTISTLTRLYRYPVAAQLLGIPLVDLVDLMSISGKQPFASPAATMIFMDLVAQVQSSDFSIAQLTYLFGSERPSPNRLTPKSSWEDALIRQLGNGLREIAKADPELTGESEESLKPLLPQMVQTQLAVLVDAAKVAPLMNLVEGRPSLVKLLEEQLKQHKLDLLGNLAAFDRNTFGAQSELLTEVDSSLTALEQFEKRLARFKVVYVALHPHVVSRLNASLVVKTLSDGLGLPIENVKQLLEDTKLLTSITDDNQNALTDFLLAVKVILPSQIQPAADNSDEGKKVRRGILRLHKLAMFINTFSLSLAELRYLRQRQGDMPKFDPNGWGTPAESEDYSRFEQWQQVAAYVAQRNQFPQAIDQLVDFLEERNENKKKQRLLEITGWSAETMGDALNANGTKLEKITDERALAHLDRTIGLSRRLGIPAVALKSWASEKSGQVQAEAIKQTVKAKYDESTWLNVAQPISDRLRERQREALVAHVLTMPTIWKEGIANANQLYEYFLIDVEMSACMLTSRIKQAISSLQLFVQRCLLNLEEYPYAPERTVRPDAINTVQWQWRKNYRVWEANRKVFLYPENWLEPELRDNKSPFFTELESELLQNDVNREQAERALSNYLDKLDQVARLQVCGMYLEEYTDPGGMERRSILHVVARTQDSTSRTYFYRRLLDNSEWTAWETIPLDIKNEETMISGINLLPVVWKKRLYLFWPQMIKQTEKPTEGPAIESGKASPVPPKKQYWEVQLAWSVYNQGAWSNKKLSTPPLNLSDKPLLHLPNIRLAALEVNEELNITLQSMIVTNGIVRSEENIGSFHWADRNSELRPLRPGSIAQIDRGILSESMGLAYQSYAAGGGNLTVAHTSTLRIQILNQSEPYTLLPLSQHYPLARAASAPLFYQTDRHAYFVQARERTESYIKTLKEDDRSKPADPWRFDYDYLYKRHDLQDLKQPLEWLAQPRLDSHPWVSAGAYLLPQDVAKVSQQLATPVLTEMDLPVADQMHVRSAVATPMNRLNQLQSTALVTTLLDDKYTVIIPKFQEFMGKRPTINLKFSPFFHPHVGEFIRGLKTHGVPGLLNWDNQVLGISYLTRPWHGSVFPMPISADATRAASAIESGFGYSGYSIGGPSGDFEAIVLEGKRLQHYRRDNQRLQQAWQKGAIITEHAVSPGCIIERKSQRVLANGAVTRPGDFEIVVLEWNEAEGHSELVHYSRDNSNPANPWQRSGVVTAQASDAGCIIETSNTRLEVIVPVGSALMHYAHNRATASWEELGVVTNLASGPGCMIETMLKSLEVVVQEGSKLVHYSRPQNNLEWQRGKVITEVASGPAWLIENRVHSAPHQGAFEVVVPEGEQLVHYWKGSPDDASHWQRGQVVSKQLKTENGKSEGVSLFQSNYGRAGNFEVFAITPQGLNHYVHEREDLNFHQMYQPNEGSKLENAYVDGPYPSYQVDFSPSGAFSQYNWELFFHIPMILATRLTQNQRFADAQQWFHYIFDPTDNSDEKTVRRFWKMWPLREVERQRIDQLLAMLKAGDNNSPAEMEVVEQIKAWERNPFQPHRIARLRLTAYKKQVVMRYIDNLIAWGDQLFRRDTLESLNEATQLYVLAANLLGPRPQRIPAQIKIPPKTYGELKPLLNEINNALIEGEHELPIHVGFNAASSTTEATSLLSIGTTFYFCIPQNEQMLAYWDLVADRLFKIRHCMNIEGVVRQLPLSEPLIDPGLLVNAAAAGLDLANVLADLNAPLPHYRFAYLLPKALELCNEVKTLGASLLAALEKKDGEELAQLRAKQEKIVLQNLLTLKQLQVDEADASLDALQALRESAILRLNHYSQMLGESGLKIPAAPTAPGKTQLVTPFPYVPTGNFKLVGGARGSFGVDSTGAGAAGGGLLGGALGAPSLGAAVGGAIGSFFGDLASFDAVMDSGTKMLTFEQEELVQSFQALTMSFVASGVESLTSALGILPNIEVATKPVGAGVAIHWGSNQLLGAGAAAARVLNAISAGHSYRATLANRLGSFVWRELDFAFRRNEAVLDIGHIDKQIIATLIQRQSRMKEVENHKTLIKNAEEVENFLLSKFTAKDLYVWMVKKVADLYFLMYQMAYDFAKRTERCFQFEHGVNNTNYVQPTGYWDTLHQGLLAGERLGVALRQMERAYLEQNRREYELTKHISLLQHDPVALLKLKELGWCEFHLPEALFDLDFPGHYFRRIRSVSITIPCIVGPYTGINCTLTLLRNSLRKVSTLSDRYARSIQNDDPRFMDDLTPIQSIATSHAQNDSGLFELNFRDERYLPFEGAGAISRWRIDLPKEFRAFDYDTISDVVLHLKYTAREGGQALGEKTVEEMKNAQNILMQLGDQAGGLYRHFSLKHEFPTEWHKLLYGKTDERSLLLNFHDRFPLIFRGKTLKITETEVFMKGKEPLTDYIDQEPFRILTDDNTTSLGVFGKWEGQSNLLTLTTTEIMGNPDKDTWFLKLDLDNEEQRKKLVEILDNVILVCHYNVQQAR